MIIIISMEKDMIYSNSQTYRATTFFLEFLQIQVLENTALRGLYGGERRAGKGFSWPQLNAVPKCVETTGEPSQTGLQAFEGILYPPQFLRPVKNALITDS